MAVSSTLLVGSTGFVGRAVKAVCETSGIAVVSSVRNAGERSSDDRVPVIDLEHYDERMNDDYHFEVVIMAASLNSKHALEGMRRLVDRYSRSRFVLLSSDAVFGGSIRSMSEADAPCPITDHGIRMQWTEEIVLRHSNSVVARCSYIYDDSPGNVDKRSQRIQEAGKEGTVIHASANVFKSPVTVQEVARNLLCVGIGTSVTGIVHIPGPRRSVYDFFVDRASKVGAPAETVVRKDAPDLVDTSLVSVRSSEVISCLSGSVLRR